MMIATVAATIARVDPREGVPWLSRDVARQ